LLAKAMYNKNANAVARALPGRLILLNFENSCFILLF
jgi:hypothetical protein